MPEIRPNSDLADLAGSIIKQHHPSLCDDRNQPRIAYCLLYTKSATELGRVKRVGDDIKATTADAPDFIVTVWDQWWFDADDNQRRALVDHLLCHCGYRVLEKKSYLRHHDFEGFRAEVERHGAWSPELMQAQVQMNYGGDETDGEDDTERDEDQQDEAVERLTRDPQFLRAARDPAPAEGSGVDTVEISAGGRTVTLTSETRRRVNEMLKQERAG